MKKWLRLPLLLASVTLCQTSSHKIPPENYGPPYLYSSNPAERTYVLPVPPGLNSYVSGGYCTDPSSGYRHPDFAQDFDTGEGVTCYCCRAGRVYYISNTPEDHITVQVGRLDSVRDTTRPNGWRRVLTLDMYRHLWQSTLLVKIGDDVVPGQAMGEVANQNHVHFEVNIQGWQEPSPVDANYLVSSIPVAFREVTDDPEGFPLLYHRYVSQNPGPDRVEFVPPSAPGRNQAVALGAFPNPFRPTAFIRFGLAHAESGVNLSVYDAAGRRVETLMSRGSLNAGSYSVPWSPQGLGAGRYVCRLEAGENAVSTILNKIE